MKIYMRATQHSSLSHFTHEIDKEGEFEIYNYKKLTNATKHSHDPIFHRQVGLSP